MNKTIEELEERVQRLEYMLDRAGIRLGAGMGFNGGNFELNDRRFLQWESGSTLPISDSTKYVKIENGTLTIRNGGLDIATTDSKVKIDNTGIYLDGDDSDSDPSVSINFINSANDRLLYLSNYRDNIFLSNISTLQSTANDRDNSLRIQCLAEGDYESITTLQTMSTDYFTTAYSSVDLFSNHGTANSLISLTVNAGSDYNILTMSKDETYLTRITYITCESEQLRLRYDFDSYTSFFVSSTGRLEITPSSMEIYAPSKLTLAKTTNQLRLAYNGSNWCDFTVGSDSNLSLLPDSNKASPWSIDMSYANSGYGNKFIVENSGSGVGTFAGFYAQSGTTNKYASLTYNNNADVVTLTAGSAVGGGLYIKNNHATSGNIYMQTNSTTRLTVSNSGVRVDTGFGLGLTPIARRPHVADSDTNTTNLRNAVNAILATLEAFGFHATS